VKILISLLILVSTSSDVFGSQNPYVMDRMAIERLTVALESYRKDTGNYPTTDEGLEVLLPGKGGENSNQHGYIKHIYSSRRNSQFYYRYPGMHNVDGFDLWLLGKDNQPGGEGKNSDCGNWDGGRGPCDNTIAGISFELVIYNVGTFFVIFYAGIYGIVCLIRRAFGTKGKSVFMGNSIYITVRIIIFILLILTFLP